MLISTITKADGQRLGSNGDRSTSVEMVRYCSIRARCSRAIL